MFSPSRCLQDRKGSQVSQVLPVPQDHPAFQEKGSQDPGVHKDLRDIQAHLEFLGKMDSLWVSSACLYALFAICKIL